MHPCEEKKDGCREYLALPCITKKDAHLSCYNYNYDNEPMRNITCDAFGSDASIHDTYLNIFVP